MFKSFKLSVFLVFLALLMLASVPAYPQTETSSVTLRPVEMENARKLLGESPSGERPDSARRSSARKGAGGSEMMTLSVPKLGVEEVPIPSSDSQVELDREGIIHLKDTGAPWKEGSNTVIVGHALGFMWTRVPYVFYQLDQLKPGDEIVVKDKKQKAYTFEIYDTLTVKPEDFWVTYPVPNKTVVSLQSCTPIPTFENRLIVRAELVES